METIKKQLGFIKDRLKEIKRLDNYLDNEINNINHYAQNLLSSRDLINREINGINELVDEFEYKENENNNICKYENKSQFWAIPLEKLHKFFICKLENDETIDGLRKPEIEYIARLIKNDIDKHFKQVEEIIKENKDEV